jgi:hypothetical protein
MNEPSSVEEHAITDVCERSLNSIITPGGILAREAENEIDDDLADSWTAGIPGLTIGVIPFLSDQRPMPPQNRIRRDSGRQFHYGLSAE